MTEEDITACATALRRSLEQSPHKTIGDVLESFRERNILHPTSGLAPDVREKLVGEMSTVYERVVSVLGLKGQEEKQVSDYLIERGN